MKKNKHFIILSCLAILVSLTFGCKQPTAPEGDISIGSDVSQEKVKVTFKHSLFNSEYNTLSLSKNSKIKKPEYQIAKTVEWYNDAKKWDFANDTVKQDIILTQKCTPLSLDETQSVLNNLKDTMKADTLYDLHIYAPTNEKVENFKTMLSDLLTGKKVNLFIYGTSGNTIIPEKAFANLNFIESVYVMDNIDTIGVMPFQGANVNSIYISSGVKNIHPESFFLGTVTPDSPNKYIRNIFFENTAEPVNISYDYKITENGETSGVLKTSLKYYPKNDSIKNSEYFEKKDFYNFIKEDIFKKIIEPKFTNLDFTDISKELILNNKFSVELTSIKENIVEKSYNFDVTWELADKENSDYKLTSDQNTSSLTLKRNIVDTVCKLKGHMQSGSDVRDVIFDINVPAITYFKKLVGDGSDLENFVEFTITPKEVIKYFSNGGAGEIMNWAISKIEPAKHQITMELSSVKCSEDRGFVSKECSDYSGIFDYEITSKDIISIKSTYDINKPWYEQATYECHNGELSRFYSQFSIPNGFYKDYFYGTPQLNNEKTILTVDNKEIHIIEEDKNKKTITVKINGGNEEVLNWKPFDYSCESFIYKNR